MQTLLERGCGLDVHQATVVACLLMVRKDGKVQKQMRMFGTTTRELVGLREWLLSEGCTHVAIDDKQFVEMLSISQSLPGLNATNLAILVGEKLGGILGSIAAILGICLPGGVLMYIVGIIYRQHGDHAWITAGLKGVTAAAVGLILSTVVELSKKSLAGRFDFVFMAMTVIAVSRLH